MPKRMNAEDILARLAKIREGMPVPSRPRPPKAETTSRIDARTVEDFEAAAVVEALESMADDLHAVIEEKRERALETALDIYYAAVELARDPAHADLAEQVAKMEAAYERDYGRPIPTKEETEARRAKKKS